MSAMKDALGDTPYVAPSQQKEPATTPEPPPQPRKSWRDVIAVHPAAELLPVMSEAELRELGEDIKENGLQNDIVVYLPIDDYLAKTRPDPSKFYLLDGRNRLDAMEKAGVTFELVYEKMSGRKCWWIGFPCTHAINYHQVREVHGDPYEFVLSANLHRRHPTAEQKRELIAKVLKAKPELSNRQIAAKTATSHPTVAAIRADLEQKGDVEKFTTSTDTLGREQPRAKPKPKRNQDESPTDHPGAEIVPLAVRRPSDSGRTAVAVVCGLGDGQPVIDLPSEDATKTAPEARQAKPPTPCSGREGVEAMAAVLTDMRSAQPDGGYANLMKAWNEAKTGAQRKFMKARNLVFSIKLHDGTTAIQLHNGTVVNLPTQ